MVVDAFPSTERQKTGLLEEVLGIFRRNPEGAKHTFEVRPCPDENGLEFTFCRCDSSFATR